MVVETITDHIELTSLKGQNKVVELKIKYAIPPQLHKKNLYTIEKNGALSHPDSYIFQCFLNLPYLSSLDRVQQGIGNQVQAHTFDDKMSGSRGCGCSTILRRPKMLYMVL